MKEELVTFETAKLAEEKEFNEPCSYYYYTDEFALQLGERFCDDPALFKVRNTTRNTDLIECTAPTQSLLQKWLREKHKIHIYFATSTNKKFKAKCEKMTEGVGISGFMSTDEGFDTYEEALEAGLLQALKLIKLS